MSVAENDDYERLESLAPRMLSQIYGQDEAIRQEAEILKIVNEKIGL